MPIAFLDVSTDLLAELCKGLRNGEKPRLYRVKENPLPDDAEVVSASLVGPPECSVVRIAIESGAVTEGQQLPSVWLEHSAATHCYAGWFVAYAYKLDGIGELCLGSTTWRITDSDKETPWQKVTRWNDEMEGRSSFVLLSWKKLTEEEFFEHDMEA